MANTTLTLQFSSKLDCGKCDDVLVEVYDPTKLAANDGVTDPTLIQHFFPATITDFTCVGSNLYQYDITFDDAVLADGVTLTECDIKRVCCAGCVYGYFQTLINRINGQG